MRLYFFYREVVFLAAALIVPANVTQFRGLEGAESQCDTVRAWRPGGGRMGGIRILVWLVLPMMAWAKVRCPQLSQKDI